MKKKMGSETEHNELAASEINKKSGLLPPLVSALILIILLTLFCLLALQQVRKETETEVERSLNAVLDTTIREFRSWKAQQQDEHALLANDHELIRVVASLKSDEPASLNTKQRSQLNAVISGSPSGRSDDSETYIVSTQGKLFYSSPQAPSEAVTSQLVSVPERYNHSNGNFVINDKQGLRLHSISLNPFFPANPM